jgi:hypothetical protein
MFSIVQLFQNHYDCSIIYTYKFSKSFFFTGKTESTTKKVEELQGSF